jgi:hypothetical protein
LQTRKPTVVFSSEALPPAGKLMQNLLALVNISGKVDSNTDFLCVTSIKKTQKILKAVALGKPVVGQKWVTSSTKELADPRGFILRDAETEREWRLPHDWSTGNGRDGLFGGRAIYVTPALKSSYGASFKDIVDIGKAIGSKVFSSPAKKLVTEDTNVHILLGLDANDADAITLLDAGITVYSKEMLPMAILRGHVDIPNTEWCIRFAPSEPKTATKKAKKK